MVKVNIPAVLLGQEGAVQSILEEVVLDEVVITVSKGGTSYTEIISIDDPEDGVEAVFDDLSTGTWNIQIVARDDDEFNIAEETTEGTVSSGETTEVDVTLDILSGYLTLQVVIPNNDNINSGKVILLGLIEGIGNIEETFEATPDDTVSIDIGKVEARIWFIKAELYNEAEDILNEGEAQVLVFPGRTTTAEVNFTKEAPGGLQVTIYWKLPPEKPENVAANL